jgi:hypothetical protein
MCLCVPKNRRVNFFAKVVKMGEILRGPSQKKNDNLADGP